jgi:hypothetical protein
MHPRVFVAERLPGMQDTAYLAPEIVLVVKLVKKG